jgi:hypothetical protein
MRIGKIENRVIEILNKYPAAKDDDNLLMTYYLGEYDDEFKHIDIYEIQFFILQYRIFTTFKSIERVRRKIQEKNPSFRGTRWLIRHMAQTEFINYANE